MEPTITPSLGQINQPPVQNVPPASEPVVKKPDRRLLIILGAILLAIVIVFAVVKLLVPRISPSAVTITWWGLWEDKNIVDPLIVDYEATHPGVKINYIKQSEKDYRERLQNALSQGQGPDIFRFHNSWAPMYKTHLDVMPASVMTASDFAATFYPSAASDLSSGSGFLGIPLEYDGLALFINTDIFSKAGKGAPKTWDDLLDTAKQLTVKDDRGIISQAGVALGTTQNVDHWPEILALMIFQNGASPSDPTDPLAQKAMEYYSQFSKVLKIWDDTLPTSTEAFSAGKLAMYFAPSWRAFEIQKANPNLKFRTVPLPQLPKNNPNAPDVGYATYWVEGVNAKSTNKTQSWDFLRYLSSKNVLEKFYSTASAVRGFGEPYPRVDMAGLLENHEILGSIIKLAPVAKSWYLDSRTNDGPTGINSAIEQYFEDAINAINAGASTATASETAASGVTQVLSQFSSRR